MKFLSDDAEIFVPDARPEAEALSRTTHLGVGAHQDDLEFMAFSGIAECFRSPSKWFGGVICTDGRGSSTRGPYEGIGPTELGSIRAAEQRHAASVGRFAFVAQLGYSSPSIRPPAGSGLVEDLVAVLEAATPKTIFTHNPADKHVTHLNVLVAVLAALRELPAEKRPGQLLGCEMWRSLDWLGDEEKVLLDCSDSEHLATALNGVFDSQIAGGKRYDLAVAGRRRANATLLNSHAGDGVSAVTYAMDLTPLIGAEASDLVDFVESAVDRLRSEIGGKLREALSA
ncbi:MAG: PIG-L family deacetylase [Chthoniobacterales bacterium]